MQITKLNALKMKVNSLNKQETNYFLMLMKQIHIDTV